MTGRPPRHVEVALAVAANIDDAASVIWARTAEATFAAAQGDHAGAVAAAVACLAHPGVRQMRQLGVRHWRIIGAEACAVTGVQDLAAQLLDVEDHGFPTPVLAIARTRAQLAIARSDDAEADRWFGTASAQLDRCEDPYQRARLHLALGAHLRRSGHRRRAMTELQLAPQGFDALRGAPWLERVDRELAASGQRRAPRRELPDLELTPQEQAVGHLVAQGMRNREIATELFVSVKTVEYHLGNAFRKLGVSNRTQLAARLDDPVS